MDVQQLAFIAGIILGSIAVLTACFVWLRHRTFGVGGGGLSLVGLALVGLSIFSTISISVSEAGVEAKFQAMQERVNAVAEASAAVTEEVQKIAQSTEANRTQFLALTQSLEARNAVDPRAAADIRRQVEAARLPEERQLNEALKRLREVQIPVSRPNGN